MAVFTGFRLAFWLMFHDGPTPLRPFLLGARFDLRLCLLLLLPSLILWAVPATSPFRSERLKRFHATQIALLVCAVVIFYLADLAHYAYLRERGHAASLRLLADTAIAVRFAWESYPVIPTVVLVLLVGIGLRFGALWAIGRVQSRVEPSPRVRRATTVLVVLAALGGVYGKASFYPLRWSDAFSTEIHFEAHLSLNPVLFFFDTLATAEEPPPDPHDLDPYYERLAQYLALPAPAQDRRSFARATSPAAHPGAPPNVLIILAESLAAHQTGMFGNPLHASPNLDEFARESLLFTRCYTPNVGTARAVFALLTGIPDTSSRQTASRNPRAVDQYVMLDAFEGYEQYYFLGGSANWANVRGLLAHNVGGIRIFEEGSYSSPRGDVWGISDLHLLEEAGRVLGSRKAPFVALIHLSGNHRPFTIPQDARGFARSDVDEASLRPHGFDSLAEFNSFRFLDHSIGWFLRAVRDEDWYRNTLIVVVGDNGDPGNAVHMPPAETELDLGRFHTPLLLHGPGVRPGRRDTIVSQIDVLPVVAGLVGQPVMNRTLGRDILRDGCDGGALVMKHRGASLELWLLGDTHCVAIDANGSKARLYAYDAPGVDVAARYPEITSDMRHLCRGLFIASRYLMYNNSRLP